MSILKKAEKQPSSNARKNAMTSLRKRGTRHPVSRKQLEEKLEKLFGVPVGELTVDAIKKHVQQLKDKSDIDTLIETNELVKQLKEVVQNQIKQVLEIDAPEANVGFQVVQPRDRTYLKAYWREGGMTKIKAVREIKDEGKTTPRR